MFFGKERAFLKEKEDLIFKEAIEMDEEEKLAEEHAEWATQFFKWVYKQAFLHGIRHGKELAKKPEIKGDEDIKCQKQK